MGDSAALYLVVLLVYLSDCLVRLPRGATAFRAFFGGFRLLRVESRTLGSRRLWVFLNPLPPLGTCFVCLPAPGAAGGDPAPRATERHDPEAIRARVDEFRAASRVLRILCNLLAIHLLIVIPAGLFLRDLSVTWFPLLAIVLVLVGAIVYEYASARRRLYPGTRAVLREDVLVMVLTPPAAARAVDALAKDLLASCDPLAVLRALGGEEAFLKAARRALYDAEDRPALAERLSRWGVATSALAKPPEGAFASWCPRCGEPHTVAEGECSECPGVHLVAMTPRAAAARR